MVCLIIGQVVSLLEKIVETEQLLERIKSVADTSWAMRKLYDERLAPDFGFFDHEAIDEMRVSRMLAVLLDPKGSHAQRGLFLHLFLKEVGITWPMEVCDSATLDTEFHFDDGRLDILIRSGDYALAIENKLWAGSPERQIERYLAFMAREKRRHSAVVFLSPTGAEPPKSSLLPEHVQAARDSRLLYVMSYEVEVNAWLAQCRVHCRADRVSLWVDEFRRMIESMFLNNEDDPMQEHVINAALDNPESVAATMELLTAQDAIRSKLFTKLASQIQDIVGSKGWQVDCHDAPYERYSGIEVSFAKDHPKFRIEFQSTLYAGLIYGLVRVAESVPSLGTLRSELLQSVGEGKESEWWLWYRQASVNEPMCPVDMNWSKSVEPWRKIADGTLAAKLAEAAGRFHAVVKDM